MATTRGGAAGLMAVLTCALALSGCASGKMQLKRQSAGDKNKSGPVTEKPFVPGVEVTEASVRGSDFAAVPELETIHFDYDGSCDEALAALKKNAEYLKARGDVDVRIAGYCDQRGTVSTTWPWARSAPRPCANTTSGSGCGLFVVH